MRGPLFYVRTKIQLRQQMAARGLKRDHVNVLMDGLDNEDIDAIAAQSGVPVPNFQIPVGAEAALGDGSILRGILEFLRSENGQKLISAILSILLG